VVIEPLAYFSIFKPDTSTLHLYKYEASFRVKGYEVNLTLSIKSISIYKSKAVENMPINWQKGQVRERRLFSK
jgi:hypothetical protein